MAAREHNWLGSEAEPTDRIGELEEVREWIANTHRLLNQADRKVEQSLEGWYDDDGGRAEGFHRFLALIDLDLVENTVRLVREGLRSQRFTGGEAT
jgi:hypothetical protein